MNTRTQSVLIGTLLVGAVVGIAFFSQGVQATELPPGGDFAYADGPSDGASGDGSSDDGNVGFGADGEAQVANGSFERGKQAGGFSIASHRRQEDTQGWTAGVVRGDIQLAVSVLDKLGSITVCVEEMRNAFAEREFTRPKRLFAKVERGRGTPTFELRDVPFSEYPYRVSVLAPGLNGGQRTVSVTKKDPLHDVVLAITPGAPFSVLLRDQDQQAHRDIDILLRPVGHPLGRPKLAGKTDNFGSVVFESVLAGGYELVATLNGHPFGKPQTVQVQPGTRNYGRKIKGQGHVMTIPRGVQLDVLVHDRFGYPMDGCTVTASRTDQRRLNELEGETDRLGRLRFPHLQPGTWQVTVQRDEFQRIDQHLTLRPDQEPVLREIKLVRTRSLGR